MLKVDELRQQFMTTGLHRLALHADPFIMFEQWYMQTIDSGLTEPNAMCLATVDADAQPWQRMVLLKTFDERGFVFFTDYQSRKAEQIAVNDKVSLLFPWQALGRQVKITGHAEKVSTAESLQYFLTRPRGSQIGAWASAQSKVITSRAMLEDKVEQIKQKFHKREMSLPSFWGGYRVHATYFEFWQARENRLHDRFMYHRDVDNNWVIERLAP